MKTLRTDKPSFYLAIQMINKLYPESNTVIRHHKRGKYYMLEVENVDGENLCYRKLQYIEDKDLRWKAQIIDMIMRIVGQGGSNITIADGQCYTRWTTFNSDPEQTMNIASYDDILLSSMFNALGDIHGMIFEIEVNYNVSLSEVERNLNTLYPLSLLTE